MENKVDNSAEIKVLADYVLVKQIMKKKKTVLLLDAAQDDKSKFDFSFEIVQVGPECKRGISVGDNPIFGDYVKFSGIKVIEKDENGMVSLLIVHENDIIAIDYSPQPSTTDSESSKN